MLNDRLNNDIFLFWQNDLTLGLFLINFLLHFANNNNNNNNLLNFSLTLAFRDSLR